MARIPGDNAMFNKRRFLPLFILIGLAALYVNLHADMTVPMNKTFAEFPLTLKSWRMVAQTELSDQVLDVLKPTDYLSRTYRDENGRIANLYIGYHGGGKEGGEIHSPKHCLPGSGWFEVSQARSRLNVGGGEINLVTAVYQKGEARELFYYWFQVRDRTISDEYSLKLAQIFNSMLHRRRDAAFIRISMPVGSEASMAHASAERFVKELYPIVVEFLPK